MSNESERGYNGWTNYETWCMALWIDNDQGSYTHSRELVAEVLERDNLIDAPHRGKIEIADALKDWQYELMPDLPASVWSDLLGAAFSEIDWIDIAENYLSE